MKKIPFYIISGFLGSGKTTFLKRIIEEYSAKQKIGIIQNEFAPSNIDGIELKKSDKDFELLEINNGSVFCVCLLGDFVRSLHDFIVKHQPDVLIIEASGLSDTTSVAEVISAGKLADKMYLASNWCVVDAQNYSRIGLMKQRVAHQIRMADVILINKIDLAKDGTDQIRESVKKINPFAEIKETSFCKVDIELKDKSLEKFYLGNDKALPRPDVNSMVIKSGRKLSEENLHKFLNHWASKAYRIKGFVNLKEGRTVAVQCTFDSVELLETEHSFHPTELIAISDSFTLRAWYKDFKSYF